MSLVGILFKYILFITLICTVTSNQKMTIIFTMYSRVCHKIRFVSPISSIIKYIKARKFHQQQTEKNSYYTLIEFCEYRNDTPR